MRGRAAAYWFSLPAVLLVAVLLVAPVSLTVLLSANAYDISSGTLRTPSLDSYASVLSDPVFHQIFLRTFGGAATTTLLCLAIGVPEAWILSRMSSGWRAFGLLVVLGPLLISVVVRTLGWTILLGSDGPIRQAMAMLGMESAPAVRLRTQPAVVIALVYVLVPFMVLAVWTSLRAMDKRVEQAALSLGGGKLQFFRHVVLPQAAPGVLSGGVIVFTMAASAYATPALIGGGDLRAVPEVIAVAFLESLNTQVGAVMAVLLGAAMLATVLLGNWARRRRERDRLWVAPA